VELLRGIAQAFTNREFGVEYQPVLNVRSGHFEGLEALLRWTNTAGEKIPPEEFVSLLEETGMIRVIGAWVMEQACRDFKALCRDVLLPDIAWVSVNVSRAQCHDLNFVERIKDVIADTGIEPNQLQFEITESLVREKGARTKCI